MKPSKVGKVLRELKRSGKEKDTVVALISDHGFLLGEHGRWVVAHEKHALLKTYVRALRGHATLRPFLQC